MIASTPTAASYVGPADNGPAAPALPVEQHAIATALALESARIQAAAVLAIMQWAPRDEPAMWAALTDLVTAVNTASASYRNYVEIRGCAGQA